MYNFFEIKCPNCGHQFVWLEHTYKGSGFMLYRRKGYDEQLESTTCPKCNTEMVVLQDACQGIDIRHESIDIVNTIRGI